MASGTALALGVLAAGGAAEAATFTVTNLGDSGPGSLRQAIESANTAAGADVINFQGGLTGTVTLTSGELQITDSVEIQGPGAGLLTVSGNDASRVFLVNSPTTFLEVTISGLTISGGNGLGAGGIFNIGEHLTLDDVVVTGNTANVGGGVGFNGDTGVLILRDSVISGNQAGEGGGLFAYGAGVVEISDTVVSNNVASTGGGGGLSFRTQFGSVAIERSSISGNSAATTGGGLLVQVSFSGFGVLDTTVSGNTAEAGGGIALSDFLTGGGGISNSTISGNQATDGPGGGILLNGVRSPLLRHATVTGNTSASSGGGIYLSDPYGGAILVNSIVAGNSAATNSDLANDADGSFGVSFSLIEDPGTANLNDNGGNVFNQDPQLGPLQNNGGPTETHLPASTSPAVNAGDNSASLPTDQRGVARPIGPAVDMGAVEVNAPAGVPIPTLGEVGRLLFAGLAGLAGYLKLRRRKQEGAA